MKPLGLHFGPRFLVYLVAGVLIILAARLAFGQANIGNFLGHNMSEPQPPPPKPPEYRFVTNQLFQIHASSLWKDYEVGVQLVETNGVIGVLHLGRNVWSAKVLVLNWTPAPASRETVRIRALPLGTRNLGGTNYLVLDLGITPQEHNRRILATNAAARK